MAIMPKVGPPKGWVEAAERSRARSSAAQTDPLSHALNQALGNVLRAYAHGDKNVLVVTQPPRSSLGRWTRARVGSVMTRSKHPLRDLQRLARVGPEHAREAIRVYEERQWNYTREDAAIVADAVAREALRVLFEIDDYSTEAWSRRDALIRAHRAMFRVEDDPFEQRAFVCDTIEAHGVRLAAKKLNGKALQWEAFFDAQALLGFVRLLFPALARRTSDWEADVEQKQALSRALLACGRKGGRGKAASESKWDLINTAVDLIGLPPTDTGKSLKEDVRARRPRR